MISLLLLNVLLQILDGVVTFIGVSRGILEGNYFMATSIHYYGLGPALILAKSSCCLAFLAVRKYEWVMLVIASFMLYGVLLPWTVFLLEVL